MLISLEKKRANVYLLGTFKHFTRGLRKKFNVLIDFTFFL